MNFADRLIEAQRKKSSIAILGVDPQLDGKEPGVPPEYTLERFCCAIVEACAASVIAIKPQLAFFEARGIEGMRAFAAGCEVRAQNRSVDNRGREAWRYRTYLCRLCLRVSRRWRFRM